MTSTILQVCAVSGVPLLPNGLTEILWILEPQADQLGFSIFAFEGVLKETTQIQYSELQEKIERSSHGLVATWDDLIALCQELADVSDLLLVGHSKSDAPPVKASFEQLVQASEIVVEVFDSTTLRLFLADAELSERAKIAFPQATLSRE